VRKISKITTEITKLWDIVQANMQYYENSEEAVKSQIIIPILKTLGWKTLDPSEVQHGYLTAEGIPDITLTIDGKPELIIEVKRLGIDIAQLEQLKKLARYCSSEGVKYGVISDGRHWILIQTFKEGIRLADRILWKIDLIDLKLPKTIQYLQVISREKILNIESEHITEFLTNQAESDEITELFDEAKEEVGKNGISSVKTSLGVPFDDFAKVYILLLLYEAPSHGYGLMTKYRNRTGRPLSAGTIYPFLEYLEKHGFVTSESNPTGKRPRRVVSFTEKGRKGAELLFSRFASITAAAFESNLQVCASCGCKVYEGVHIEEIDGKQVAFCCPHCAGAYQQQIQNTVGK
jgi:DNA-binding PadR family transcriptional regulator